MSEVAMPPLGNSRTPQSWLTRRQRLRKSVEETLQHQQGRVNINTEKHSVIGAVLRSFAYDSRYSGRSLKAVFLDGSTPPDFPLGVLVLPEGRPQNSHTRINLGLMSLRHPEMDFLVDLYVARNRELAEQPTMAEEEALAYERTVTLLLESRWDSGGTLLVYHTGLEPMVYGFYRGVVEVLRQRSTQHLPRNLVIQPMLFSVKGEKTDLSPSSPGAKESDYLPCLAWW